MSAKTEIIDRLELDAHDEEITAIEAVDSLMREYATTSDPLSPPAAAFGAKLRALARSWTLEPQSKYERLVFISLLLSTLRVEIGIDHGVQTWDDMYVATEIVRKIIGSGSVK